MITPSLKLEWYAQNAPHNEQWAKNIFIDAVSFLRQSYSIWFIFLQLRPYYSTERTNVPEPSAPQNSRPPSEQQSTAAGILGLGRIRRRTAQRTLEAEVQMYLSEPPISSNSLSYWEV